jgi:hypothetical protein
MLAASAVGHAADTRHDGAWLLQVDVLPAAQHNGVGAA